MSDSTDQLAIGDTGWTAEEIKTRRAIYLLVFVAIHEVRQKNIFEAVILE